MFPVQMPPLAHKNNRKGLGVHRISNLAENSAGFNKFSDIRYPAGFGESPAEFAGFENVKSTFYLFCVIMSL